jgi:putative Ca2+/H+ antiporter (TMEM165/GDT1 family)
MRKRFWAVAIGALVGLALQQVVAFVAGESCSS